MGEKLIGYNGKIAFIDLDDQQVEIKDLDHQIAKDYLGGTGLSAKLIYDRLSDEDYETLKKDPQILEDSSRLDAILNMHPMDLCKQNKDKLKILFLCTDNSSAKCISDTLMPQTHTESRNRH